MAGLVLNSTIVLRFKIELEVVVPTDNNLIANILITTSPTKRNRMEFPVMELGQTYFYTATILKWQNLLKLDKYKDIIINSLKYWLCTKV